MSKEVCIAVVVAVPDDTDPEHVRDDIENGYLAPWFGPQQAWHIESVVLYSEDL